MTFKEIQDLIKMVNRYGLKKVSIQNKDFKINIEGHSDHTETLSPIIAAPAAPIIQAPAQVAAAAPTPAATPATSNDSGDNDENSDAHLVPFKSPMIGTFYRRPSPDKEAYLKVGDVVEPGKVVCIIEAMKLFNDIECDISGKVVKILVDDASPVEYDQVLFLVDPNA